MLEIYHADPVQSGLYVAYVNDLDNPRSPFAKRIFLVWSKGWFYPSSDQRFRGTVYQSAGPFPAMRLED